MPHRKNAKAAQLDPLVALQCVDDLTKNDIDESPHVTMKEVPVLLATSCTRSDLTIGAASEFHFLFFLRPPPSVTPSIPALRYIAPTLRLSLRAIIVVFTLSRANVFSVRTSSVVHVRSFVVIFAIVCPRCTEVAKRITGDRTTKPLD